MFLNRPDSKSPRKTFGMHSKARNIFHLGVLGSWRFSVCCLLIVGSLAFLSCRETFSPTDESPVRTRLRFSPGDSFTYDNWKVTFGGRDASSRFTNTWTVTDTGLVMLSMSHVTLIIDSTFGANERFVRRDTLLFSLHDNGDVYQYGFLRSLIAERETLTIVPQWERIAALSQSLGSSWTIARLDTSTGLPRAETVVGVLGTTRPYVGVTVNGVVRGLLAYDIDISKPKLRYNLLLLDSPAAIVQTYDQPDVLTYDLLRQLRTMRTR